MTIELNELDPCPYCWHYRGECTTPDVSQAGGYYWAICPACLFSIAGESKAQAIELWNKAARIPRGPRND